MNMCPLCDVGYKDGSITIESVCLNCAKDIYETYKKLFIDKVKSEVKPKNNLDRIYSDSFLQECYGAGFDAGKNGANTTNSNCKWFTNPDRTKAWERGNKKGKAETPIKKQ